MSESGGETLEAVPLQARVESAFDNLPDDIGLTEEEIDRYRNSFLSALERPDDRIAKGGYHQIVAAEVDLSSGAEQARAHLINHLCVELGGEIPDGRHDENLMIISSDGTSARKVGAITYCTRFPQDLHVEAESGDEWGLVLAQTEVIRGGLSDTIALGLRNVSKPERFINF